MHRLLLRTAIIGCAVSAVHAQQRVESTRLDTAEGTPQVHAVQGLTGLRGVQGVGARRSLPNRFEFRNNDANGRSFEHSFGMTTNTQFRSHNLNSVSEGLIGQSLYNNPWYWQNLGSLDTELMTGGSGLPIASAGTNGDFFNPYFYNQWKTTPGLRHSGAMSSEIGRRHQRYQPMQDTNDRRDQAGPASLPGTGDPLALTHAQPGLLAADRSVLAGHRLHSTLRSDIDDSWSGRIERHLGRGVGQDKQPLRYLGSSLRGMGTAPAGAGLLDSGLSSFDLARLREDQMAGRTLPSVGQAWDTRFKDLTRTATAVDTRIEPGAPTVPVSKDLGGTYQAVADRYASLHPATMTLDQRLSALDVDYRRMRGELITGPTWLTDRGPVDTSPQVPGGLTNASTPSPTEPGTGEAEQPETPVLAERPRTLSWEDYGLVLRHGQRIDQFDTGEYGRFNDLIVAAEQRLGSGDYFWAERRFNRALRFIPGHPLATAGMGHAQIGASLYLSAALTLQSLLAFQPEMIDVQYGAGLLPSQKDLDRAVSILTARIQGDVDLDRYGFLLAYIGHQLDRQDLVQAGLDAMRRGGADRSFTQLLAEIWGPTPMPSEIP